MCVCVELANKLANGCHFNVDTKLAQINSHKNRSYKMYINIFHTESILSMLIKPAHERI